MPFHRFSYWYVTRTDLTLAQYRWCAKYRWIAKWSISYALIGNKKHPNSRVEVFKGCKHWSVKERPRKFCKIVDSVL